MCHLHFILLYLFHANKCTANLALSDVRSLIYLVRSYKGHERGWPHRALFTVPRVIDARWKSSSKVHRRDVGHRWRISLLRLSAAGRPYRYAWLFIVRTDWIIQNVPTGVPLYVKGDRPAARNNSNQRVRHNALQYNFQFRAGSLREKPNAWYNSRSIIYDSFSFQVFWFHRFPKILLK